MPEARRARPGSRGTALPLYHIFGLMVMLAYMSVGAKSILVPNPRDMEASAAPSRTRSSR